MHSNQSIQILSRSSLVLLMSDKDKVRFWENPENSLDSFRQTMAPNWLNSRTGSRYIKFFSILYLIKVDFLIDRKYWTYKCICRNICQKFIFLHGNTQVYFYKIVKCISIFVSIFGLMMTGLYVYQTFKVGF